VDFAVVVNERQVLALLIGIGLFIGRADYLTMIFVLTGRSRGC